MARRLGKAQSIIEVKKKASEETKQKAPDALDDILYGSSQSKPEESAPRPVTATANAMKRAQLNEKMKSKYSTGIYTSLEFKPNDNRLSPTKASNGLQKQNEIKPVVVETFDPKGSNKYREEDKSEYSKSIIVSLTPSKAMSEVYSILL